MLTMTNHAGYVKDTSTGAIINNNEDEYKKFLAAREATKNNNNILNRLAEVENDVREIKDLLLQLTHRNN